MPPRHPFTLERSFTHRLHTLNKLTDRTTHHVYLREAGVALGEARCLAAVGAFAPVSVNMLAALANLDKAQASRAAQSLVAQGLVRKAASAADARGVELTLTASGQRRWERLRPLIERRNDEITACLDADERRTLDALLDKLVAHARAAAAGPEAAGPDTTD